MANYTGYLLASPAHGYSEVDRPTWIPTNGWGKRWDVNWSGNADYFLRGWGLDWNADWSESTKSGWRPRESTGYSDAVSSNSGAYTNNRPIGLREYNWTGHLAGSFSDIFYNRILMSPSVLDFGSVVTEQSLNITVWNAFFVEKTLVDTIETDFDSGTSFSGETTPSDFGVLEERTYQVTVTPDGPPTIDATLTFDWEIGVASTSTSIIGSRVLMLPLVFGGNIRETLAWKTNVLNSWNGTEQRVRNRLAPRQQLEINAYLPRSEMHRIDNLLYRSREQIWVMAMWIEARTGSAITQDDTVISVDTRYGDFRVNSLAIVWESPEKYDVFQIAAKTDSTLTSTSGINDDYASPIIMPVRSTRILGRPTRTTSGYDARLSLNIEVTDNIELSTSPSAQQYLSTDTWFEQPLAISDDGVPDSYQHRIDVVDFETGAVQIFAPWDHIRIGRNIRFLFEGLQAIWGFREWLHRRGGRLIPFYMPTFENNFNLVSTGIIGTTFEAIDYDYDFSISGRDHLVFKLSDGTWEPRAITDSEVTGNNVLVTIDTALNRNASEVEEIGFFGLKRLSSDQIELEWLPNNVLSVTLSILEIAP